MSDLWGGRFEASLDSELRRFSSSLAIDRRLVRQDLTVSRAHAEALADAGLVGADELTDLIGAIGQIEREVDDDRFPVLSDEPPEDIHSAIEARLTELCGDTAKRLHAGRSRNDQVVTDVLLWLREAYSELESSTLALQRVLLERAEAYPHLIIYAYTHLQRAQPVLLAHHLMAHHAALQRDLERLQQAADRADRCPLGAGACVGSSLPLDREASRRRLGFARVAMNSLDAVADRDWAIECVSVCALLMTHVSRLAEELVLWSSQEFAQVRLSDAFTTGSSMMPQKRNPDVAELVRGKRARVLGDLTTLHTLVGALPLAYNRDLQEDKEPLFDAVDTSLAATRILAAALKEASFQPPRPLGVELSAATDLAEELVKRGVPFRIAHERTGGLVRACESSGRGLSELSDAELASTGLEGLDRALLTPEGSIAAKRTLGSTHPDEVAKAVAQARRQTAD